MGDGGYAAFDDSSANCPRASARPIAASARRRCLPASRSTWLTGTDLTEGVGTPSARSTRTPVRANGAGPTSPAISSRWSASSCRTCRAGLRQARRALDRRRPQFLGPDAIYGRYWVLPRASPLSAFRVCYYQAITMPSPPAQAVEAGAKATTNSRAATCRRRLPPTGSPIRFPHGGRRALAARERAFLLVASAE